MRIRGIHSRTHEHYVDGCTACKFASVMLSPAVISSPQPGYRTQKRVTSVLQRDGDAYWRLRRQGLQPKHIAGSAFLERQADTTFEVERGKVYRGEAAKPYKEAMTICDDGGFDPGRPYATPKPVEGD